MKSKKPIGNGGCGLWLCRPTVQIQCPILLITSMEVAAATAQQEEMECKTFILIKLCPKVCGKK